MSYVEPTVPLFFDQQIFDEVFGFSRNIIPDLVIKVVVNLVDEVERLVIVVTSEWRVATESVGRQQLQSVKDWQEFNKTFVTKIEVFFCVCEKHVCSPHKHCFAK